MNILITGIGGPTPRSIAKHIRKTFYESKIIGVDANKKAMGFYMDGMSDISLIIPRADSENYWPKILRIIEEYKIDLAFVQPELEVTKWGEYYQKNGKYPCPVLIPPLIHVN